MTDHVRYMERTREYYRAQGFDEAYRWAHFEDVPFTKQSKPLRESVVALVTTAAPVWRGDPDDRPPPSVYAMPSLDPPAELYTAHRSWDKKATHTRDMDSYFPIHRAQELAAEGRFILGPRAFGIPTEYSHRATMEEDAPELLRLCREDHVDAAILVPL
jgi:D-proline reductase (dithiol) PrdB